MEHSGVLYRYVKAPVSHSPVVEEPMEWIRISQPYAATAERAKGSWMSAVGIALIALSLGGMFGPLWPRMKLEAGYYSLLVRGKVTETVNPTPALPPAVPKLFDPLKTPEGASISPINTDFAVIIPKVGINAAVIPAVNPATPGDYLDALKKGVAHSSTSFFPNENGTVYLFSHSTNYDWFVDDLNAVFYLLKNLQTDDLIVVIYQSKRYTYKLTDKKVVHPSAVSYLTPQPGEKKLILQTCWPPGSIAERLLLFADLIEESELTV